MTISLIAALDRKRAIGKQNALPWYLPADLKRFKGLTMGHPIIMGRKTHDSIGKPLPGRTNIVITRYKPRTFPENPTVLPPVKVGQSFPQGLIPGGKVRGKNYQAPGCVVVRSPEEAIAAAEKAPDDSSEIFVIGGAEIFREFLPRAEKMYLTLIDHDFGGDVFFPEFDQNEWREVSREPHVPDEKNLYFYTFVELRRIQQNGAK